MATLTKQKKETINPILALWKMTNKICQITKNEKEINVVETCARTASVSVQLLTHSVCDIKNLFLFDTTEEIDKYSKSLDDSFSSFEEKYKERIVKNLGPKKGDVKNCFMFLDPRVTTVFVIDPFNLKTVESFFVNLKKYTEIFPEFKYHVVINNAWKRHPDSAPKLIKLGAPELELVENIEYQARSLHGVTGRGYPYRNWSIWN